MRVLSVPLLISLLALVPSASAAAQEAEVPGPKVQSGEVKSTARGSGVEMYTNYCAACHGLNGKGNGPAARALKGEISDLSRLARKNGGKFPADRVASVLRFGVDVPAHGSSAMPTWGPLLRAASSSQDGEVQLRIANLIKYLESLQTQ